MHITSVEVLNRRVDPATRDDCADVVFHSGLFISRFVAKAPRASRGSELVKDALRQLRRMPEFRSGAQKIRFGEMTIPENFGEMTVSVIPSLRI